MTLATPGSLAALMDQLVALEGTIDPALRVYRWQPAGVPELPALWNWIGNAPYEQKDLHRWRDNLVLYVRLGVRHTDVDEEMARVEQYADRAREVLDYEFRSNHVPLGGTVTMGQRTDMQMIGLSFNEVPVLCIQFPLSLRLDRLVQ